MIKLASTQLHIRASEAEDEPENDEEVGDLREVAEEAEEEAAEREQEDAARRGRPGLSRDQLIGYAEYRGIQLSKEEQSASMNELHKVVLDRLAALVHH